MTDENQTAEADDKKLHAAYEYLQERTEDPRTKALLYLAENTPESLSKAHRLSYESGMPVEINKAIAESNAASTSLLKSIISETRHNFEGDNGSTFITDYRFNRGKFMKDPHNRRAGSIAAISACLESPKADRLLFFDGIEALKQITENVEGGTAPGSNKNVYEAFAKAINNPNATDEILGRALMTLYHMEDHRLIDEKRKPEQAIDMKDALDVFAAAADEKNAAKHSVDSIDDFYMAISAFDKSNPDRVTQLVNKMMKHELNDENTLRRANRVLSGIRVQSHGKVNVHVNEG